MSLTPEGSVWVPFRAVRSERYKLWAAPQTWSNLADTLVTAAELAAESAGADHAAAAVGDASGTRASSGCPHSPSQLLRMTAFSFLPLFVRNATCCC